MQENETAAAVSKPRAAMAGAKEDQTVEERRKLRQQYRSLMRGAAEQKDAMVRVDGAALREMLNEADALHKNVKKAREQVIDSQLLCQLTAYGVEIAKKLGSGAASAVSAKDLCVRLKARFVRGVDPQNAPVHNPSAFPWADVAACPAARHLLRPAAGFACMNGPLDTQPKERKVAQRKAKTQVAEVTNPGTMAENAKTEEEEQREIAAVMKTVFGVLAKEEKDAKARDASTKGVPLVDLCTNKDSFAQTIENLFALSFLVRDGRVRLVHGESGILASPCNAPVKGDWDRGDACAAQFVVNLSPAEWRAMKESVSRPMMPHRATASGTKRGTNAAGGANANKAKKARK